MHPEIGLVVLIHADELAVAIQTGEYRDHIPTDLVTACEGVITTATMTIAAKLTDLTDTVQALTAFAS